MTKKSIEVAQQVAGYDVATTACLDMLETLIAEGWIRIKDASVTVLHDTASDAVLAVLNLPLAGMSLRLAIAPEVANAMSRNRIVDMVRARVSEAVEQQDRFAARVENVHGRLLASVERARASMRLVSIGMHPLSMDVKFRCDELELSAVIEMLDDFLETELTNLQGRTWRDLAGQLRHQAAIQRRRAIRRTRFNATGAVLEVDAFAEAVITAHGYSMADILSRLRGPDRYVELGGSYVRGKGDTRIGLSLLDGLLVANGWVPSASPPAYVYGSELRIDCGLDEARCAEIVGKRAAVIFDHPTMVSSAVVESARVRDGRSTVDLKLRVSRRLITEADLQAD